MAVKDEDVVAVERFLGLRNTVSPESFEIGDLDAATNVDVTDALKLRRRKGFSSALVAGECRSLFADTGVMVAVVDGTLTRIHATGAGAALRSGVGGRLAYAAVAPRIYYSDGALTGCIDGGTHRTWGIEPPGAQPVAAARGGLLLPGTYQYALTFVRSDGQESGTGAAGLISLTGGGGISFSSIPVSDDANVVAKRLYVSPTNGDMLFRVMTLAADAATATYDSDTTTSAAPLTTQFLQPPVAGQALLAAFGRVFVARGSKLRYTEPYAYELMDMRRGFTMPQYITALAAVDDGMYVCTAAEIVWLPGTKPAAFEYRPGRQYGAIDGTVAYCNAEDIDPQFDGIAALIGTNEGICACLNGGRIVNLTKERFQYPATERGAGVVRGHGGAVQYLMSLEGTAGAANTAF